LLNIWSLLAVAVEAQLAVLNLAGVAVALVVCWLATLELP
jgi:hypothetical protein